MFIVIGMDRWQVLCEGSQGSLSSDMEAVDGGYVYSLPHYYIVYTDIAYIYFKPCVVKLNKITVLSLFGHIPPNTHTHTLTQQADTHRPTHTHTHAQRLKVKAIRIRSS